jgi:integrase
LHATWQAARQGKRVPWLSTAAQQSNIASHSFHDLRHTCTTLLLTARVNPKVVSEMLGHASVSSTLDIYSHVIPDMQQDAAAIMAAVLQQTEPLMKSVL